MAFSEKTLDFLIQNRLEDSRDWFHAHKAEYREYVLRPFEQLVCALEPTLLKIDGSLITEPRVDKTISRIYRDTRFSRDKSLYRDRMWCAFMRDKRSWQGYPGFYLEITPQNFSYGCGYYCTGAKTMQAMREMILEGDPDFKKALRAYRKQDTFQIEGELYKRPRYSAQPKELRQWLERKTINVGCESQDFALLFSDELPQRVSEGFRALAPVYRFFLKAELRAAVG